MLTQKDYLETKAYPAPKRPSARPILRLKTNPRKQIRPPEKVHSRIIGPTQYTRLENPYTGQTSFGHIPAVKGLPGGQPVAAPVFLPFGRHNESLSGFGANHIWERHRGMLLEHGIHGAQGVADFISTVFRDGASLFWQGQYEDSFRISAFRPSIAKVVLEYQEKRGEFFWNIITAFPAEDCDGDFVGSLVPARARIAA